MDDSVNSSKISDSNTPATDIPKSDIMHDVWVATGYNKQLTQKDMPVPQPDPHDVVISVRAASLNPVDQKILDGEMRALMSFVFPLISGSDGAGVVSQVGSEVTRFKPGDRVFSALKRTGWVRWHRSSPPMRTPWRWRPRGCHSPTPRVCLWSA
ncbi:alcohol dehydrogenase catalytic domain-containing protein [Corynebacterium sp. c7Ub_26]